MIATGASAERIDRASIRVIDGDTIEIDGQSIHLVGFDTPERWEPECDYARAFGALATDRLVQPGGSGMGLDVTMLPGRDRYDRGLGRQFIENVDLGDILTADGLARPYERGQRARCFG
jgi:endonuclease YncB( thermonuclease family)